MSASSNIANIARREYLVRVRTRSFVLGTLLLVLGVAVISFLPVIIRATDQLTSTDIAVVATEARLAESTATTLDTLLNASAGSGSADTDPLDDFTVTVVQDVEAGRRAVVDGTYEALLAIDRSPAGELEFVLYTNENATGRTAALVRQGASAVSIDDRLDRLGVAPEDQASLFAPATFAIRWPDAARTDPTQDTAALLGKGILGFGMTILIFMLIIMYGTWIAMSVVEEKSSRVMEVILNAATPFQLLAGKVFGVGAVAFTQYAAIVVVGVLALAIQAPVASAVLGIGGEALDLPQGLSPAMLLAFGVYGVLGFLLYASLYAAAGSLVSRQEDVNSVVLPMTLISTAGYMIGVYAATGLIDIRAGWVTLLSLLPFVSPYMMLGRIAVGEAAPWELVVSILLLMGAIAVALWVAARIYTVGVLLYGSRPGARAVWRLLREGM
jgi:ABC-2 type transport system permease protein